MAHKTLINGTAYEISGGKTLVNGTAYNIKNGKTLVGGTAYEVGFVKPTVKVLLGSDTNSYFKVGELSSAGIYEVPVGETLIFDVGGDDALGSYISKNNELVVDGSGVPKSHYEHTLTADVAIQYSSLFQSHNCSICEALDGGIVFVINRNVLGGSFAAEDGMTWAEWCNSDYNTGITEVSGDSVKIGETIVKYNNIAVKPTDKIIGFGIYYT